MLPRETFFNLTPEKRQRILDSALDEIAAHGYDKASVTRIVKGAGIATGSFYQYFEDMDDLFIFVGMEAGRLKARYIQQAIDENPGCDLESCIRAMYVGGLRFGLENEKYYACAQNMLQMQNTALFQKMVASAEKSDLAVWLYRFVSEAIANGELHEGITPELFFKLLVSVNAAIIEYLLALKPGREMTGETLETLCDLGVKVILYGIRKPKETDEEPHTNPSTVKET